MAFFKSLTIIIFATVIATNGMIFKSLLNFKMKNQYESCQKINRGDFAQPRINKIKLNFLASKELQSLNKSVGVETICSYEYNILYHLILTNPKMYDFPTSVKLYKHIDEVYPWALKMLVYVINWNIPYRRIHTHVFWLFYFYTKQISTNTTTEVDRELYDEILRKMHKGMTTLVEELQLRENSCTMYNKTLKVKRDPKFYLAELEQKKPSWDNVFKELKLYCLQVKENLDFSTVVINEEHFYLNRLYLNNVVDDSGVMDTLISRFVKINNGDDLVNFMVANMNVVKDRMYPLHDYVVSLYNFQQCFITLLNVIMLKIWFQHLTYLETQPQNIQLSENKLFNIYLTNYSSFVEIDEKRPDKYLEVIVKFKTKSILSNEEIGNIKQQVTDSLNGVRRFLNGIMEFNWAPSFDSNNDKESELELTNFAKKNDIQFSYDTSRSIKCAEIFVSYIKQILPDVNFKIIRSAMTLRNSVSFHAYRTFLRK